MYTHGKIKLLFLVIGIFLMTNTMAADFIMTSSAFKNGEKIPMKYSCDDKDISPPLSWSNPPSGTKSFALICSDPDAPAGTWYHWVIFNIPNTITFLAENHISAQSFLGENSWGRNKYNGPCPPHGKPHHYIFTLYALDTKLNLPQGSAAEILIKAMQRHILASTQIIGLFDRK
jgi:Raf kinase inhibitor-like YbhB/YbcL family protein